MAGAPVQLPSYPVDAGHSVLIKAKESNTGKITLGFSSAQALNTGPSNYSLLAGEVVSINTDNSNRIWIDSTVNGEGVEVLIGANVSMGGKKMDLMTSLAGEDLPNDVMKVEERFNYQNITTATTTTVKSGVGVLHSITVNTTAAGTITIYDNTAGSGTKIATLKASIGENTYFFDVSFTVGLTIVTAAASDITVSYR